MIKLKIYVAGVFKSRSDCEQVTKILTEHSGLFEVVGGCVGREDDVSTPQALANDAERAFSELTHAHVLVVIMADSQYHFRDALAEIGFALGQHKRILILCPGSAEPIEPERTRCEYYCQSNVFLYHPFIEHYNTLDGILQRLKESISLAEPLTVIYGNHRSNQCSFSV